MKQQIELGQVPSRLVGGFERYFADLRDACEQQGLSLPDDDQFWQTVARVFVGSEYVASSLIQQPILLNDLFNSGDIKRSYSPDHYSKQMQDIILACESESLLMQTLRQLRRREMVRIIWRDLAGLATLDETLGDLTQLADCFLQHSLAWLQRDMGERYGVPLDKHGEPQALIMIAVGKLGGYELNISSDIDLMFCYPEDGDYEKRGFCYSVEQYFTKQAQRLIHLLDQCTVDGFVYRVDMRLRPYGDSGPLVMSLTALNHYFQQHGREWERYALTKARIINQQAPKAEQLQQSINSFVFRRYLDYGIIESLRELKQVISQEVKRKNLENNVKRGPGGIREIEFIEQSIRLMRGGQDKFLRHISLLTSYQYIKQQQLLPATVVDELTTAYRFLRQVEHCLQAYADEQTHRLPSKPLAQIRLCFSLRLRDWHEFMNIYHYHQARVEYHFANMIAQQDDSDASFAALQSVCLNRFHETQAVACLQELGFSEAKPVWQLLQHVQNSAKYRQLSARGVARFMQLLPIMLQQSLRYPEPLAVLQAMIKLVEVIMMRSAYMVLLAQHPPLLTLLMDISQKSTWLYQCICRQPILLDELLGADNELLFDKKRLHDNLQQQIKALPSDELDQLFNVLWRFKQAQTFHIAYQEMQGNISAIAASGYLSNLTELILTVATQCLWQYLAAKHGEPQAGLDSFMIIAYGKLGSQELSYASDLDLVFIYDADNVEALTHGRHAISEMQFYLRLVQRLINFLTTRVEASALYDVDTRLRPSGESGLLVTSLSAYQAYQQEQAWVWEHQALVRARAITGGETLQQAFNRLRHTILQRQRDQDELKQDVMAMREKMRAQLDRSSARYFDLKQGRGGLVDIEFFVQYLILNHSEHFPKLSQCRSVLRSLARCYRYQLLSVASYEALRQAYIRLTQASHEQLLFSKAPIESPIMDEDMQQGLKHSLFFGDEA